MRVFVCNLLLLCLSLGTQGLIRVPLVRTEVPDVAAFQTYVNNLKAHNSGPRYLKDYGYVPYVGEVGLGSPAQKFKVLFDTAIPALWVPSQKFNSGKSSSFENLADCKVSRPYTTGHFDALNKKDVLQIGGATVKSQSFELVTTGFEDKKFDGIFGLAYPSPSPRCGPEVVPVQNMADQGISPAVFSFRYNKGQAHVNDVGEVIFGVDTQYVDEAALDYVTLSQKANWQIPLESVAVKVHPLCAQGTQAIIDSASPAIVGPVKEVDLLYKHIGGDFKLNNGVYEIDCQKVEQLPVLVFTINKKEYKLNGEDYVLKFGTTCVSSLAGIDLPDKTWVLGDAFMKKFYTVFDQEKGRVAFGQLKGGN